MLAGLGRKAERVVGPALAISLDGSKGWLSLFFTLVQLNPALSTSSSHGGSTQILG